MLKTITMKGSPFAKEFIGRITDHENSLNYLLNLFNMIVKVQSVWMFLQPVFSSPDIVKVLPNEGVRF